MCVCVCVRVCVHVGVHLCVYACVCVCVYPYPVFDPSDHAPSLLSPPLNPLDSSSSSCKQSIQITEYQNSICHNIVAIS